jgi:hypothetical protein
LAQHTIYRDSRNGRFARASTAKRSIAKGGKRYKKEQVGELPPPPPPPLQTHEWIVAFTYDRTGKSFDVIPTATNENDAYDVALQFLRDDPKGQRILTPSGRRLKRGWEVSSIARGKETNEPPGQAEYREESEDES